MTRDEVAWCRQRVTRLEDELAVTQGVLRRQQDFFAEIAAAWRDSAGRRILRDYVEPLASHCGRCVQALERQLNELSAAVQCMQDSVEPSATVTQLSEEEESLRKTVHARCDASRADAEIADRLGQDAHSSGAAARRILHSL